MREIISFNDWWAFSKTCDALPAVYPSDWELVELPHTWNADDGQDGGSDYYRGACWYACQLDRPAAADGSRIYLEFEGASAVADVYVNGRRAAHHEGGYSTFRADVTDFLKDGDNLICVCVDNRDKSNVYPQMADFTFYGGLYRDVNMIIVPESHFDLDFHGSNGLAYSSRLCGGDALVQLDAYVIVPAKGDSVQLLITDEEGQTAAEGFVMASAHSHMELRIKDAHLWQGVTDPYLYSVTARLIRHNEVVDEVASRLGIREFTVDPEKGFFLNGIPTPLRGVSRHQDLLGKGSALTAGEHLRDDEIIRELGANTVRLAHYQHNQVFYDACDALGLVVWAEIPFISVMNPDPAAHENCISQMKELIYQNFNHPSICFWGISNEITIGGEVPGLEANLRALNDLVHTLDPTRLSTMAQVSMLPMESPQNQITDVLSYNHYFGWYVGSVDLNEKWLDEFHAKYPDRALGISEYGAEGIITYHNDDPKVRDYSEDYQALYHEHMARIISERPYLWATHVWNMFDFGCDARDEGGVKGRNNKGLVTMDRKIRKDAFYIYKAYWSDDPFVHICGRRYAVRTGDVITVKVYSNLSEVALYMDGELIATQQGDKIFTFPDLPFSDGYHSLTAVSGGHVDSITLQRAANPEPSYVLIDEEDTEAEGVANWFENLEVDTSATLTCREGYFSIDDTVGDIIANEEAAKALTGAMSSITGMRVKLGMMAMMMKDKKIRDLGAMTGNTEPAEDSEVMMRLNTILQNIKK